MGFDQPDNARLIIGHNKAATHEKEINVAGFAMG